MLPAGPNKKIKRRAEQDTLLSRKTTAQKEPCIFCSQLPRLYFFFHCVPFCSRSAILSYSLLSLKPLRLS